MMRLIRIPRSATRGVAAVEFALILPILLLLMLGLIEFGRAVWTQSSLDFAVQAVARCVAIDTNTCGTYVQIKQFALSKGLPPDAELPQPSRQSCGFKVTATLPYDFLVPDILPYSTTLSATACFPV